MEAFFIRLPLIDCSSEFRRFTSCDTDSCFFDVQQLMYYNTSGVPTTHCDIFRANRISPKVITYSVSTGLYSSSDCRPHQSGLQPPFTLYSRSTTVKERGRIYVDALPSSTSYLVSVVSFFSAKMPSVLWAMIRPSNRGQRC